MKEGREGGRGDLPEVTQIAVAEPDLTLRASLSRLPASGICSSGHLSALPALGYALSRSSLLSFLPRRCH